MHPGTGAGAGGGARRWPQGCCHLVMKGLLASDPRRIDMGGWAGEEGACPKHGSTGEEGREELEQ